MFFGVLYHLRHPLLALEKIFSVASGSLLLQTANFEDEALGDESAAKVHPFGIQSGTAEQPHFDPTVSGSPTEPAYETCCSTLDSSTWRSSIRAPGPYSAPPLRCEALAFRPTNRRPPGPKSRLFVLRSAVRDSLADGEEHETVR